MTDEPNASAYDRFVRASAMDHDAWHDGRGHDLDAIREANADERHRIEQFLLAQGVRHPRDVEALAALHSPAADEALRAAIRSDDPAIRAAVIDHAPQLLTPLERERELVARIDAADAFAGLDATLRQVEDVHPPTVIDAMLRRIARDPGVAAVHFAAMLLYLHGQANEPFDWEQRPFFLRFNEGNPEDHRAAFRALCDRIGVDATRFPTNMP